MLEKIRLSYFKIPEGVKASFWFTVCSIVQKGIQLVTVPLFTRILTTEQYGQFSLYQSWLGIITILGTLNLFYGAFNNAMLKYEQERDKYISSMQGLSTITSLGLIVLFAINRSWWCEVLGMDEIVIWFLLIEILFYSSLQYWTMRQRFEYKYKALVAITLFIAFLNPILGLLLVNITTEKGIARIISVSAINIVVGVVFYILNAKRGKAFYVKEFWKYALVFNLPLIPHYLSSIVLAQSDRIMIEKMFGESSVAIYSVAYSIASLMAIVVNSVNASFVPWTYQKCKEKDYAAINKGANGLVLLVAIMVLIPIMLAPEALFIMGTEEYYSAVWVIPPVAISTLMTFIYSLFANIEFYHEKTKFVMVASCVAAILNIGLNVVFMPVFGFVAAGYTTLFCYIVLAVTHYVFMRKICKKEGVNEHLYNKHYIISVVIVTCVCSCAFMLLYNFYLIRYSVIIGIGIVCIIKRKYFIQILKNVKKR